MALQLSTYSQPLEGSSRMGKDMNTSSLSMSAPNCIIAGGCPAAKRHKLRSLFAVSTGSKNPGFWPHVSRWVFHGGFSVVGTPTRFCAQTIESALMRAHIYICRAHKKAKTQAFGLGFSWWARLGLNQ